MEDSENSREPTELVEDPRKVGLKKGLRQLTVAQLQQVRDYPGPMILDRVNYKDGCFCPLAIGLGLDLLFKPTALSDWTVFVTMANMGYSVNNTRGIAGTFYTTDRRRDLLIAVDEVIAEKEEIQW